MAVTNSESAFVSPSIIAFYIYLFILTIVVAFLSPLFTTQSELVISDGNESRAITRALKGYLTKIECSDHMTQEICSNGQKNGTPSIYMPEYPSTIAIVQMSVCCPFVLVIVICCYWEGRRHRNLPVKTVTVVVICIQFEILHTLGYMFFPVFIGPEVGFSWSDLDLGFYIGIFNILFVWTWLVVKIYSNKRLRFKRKYKTRKRRSDPVYIANKFIFVEQNPNNQNPAPYATADEEVSNVHMERERDGVVGYQGGNVCRSVDTLFTTEGVVNDGFEMEQSQTTERPVVHTVTNETFSHEQRNIVEEHIPTHSTRDTDIELNVETEDEVSDKIVCIKSLIGKLWSPRLVGIGRDAHTPCYARINIKTINHVQNESVWNLYMKKKKEILNSVADHLSGKLFSPEDFGTDINPVKTDKALEQVPENNLENNIDKKINEYYLFHGTDVSNIASITQNGFDKSNCQRTMLGKGIYFTDHPVKADQYTGTRGLHGEQTTCCMILARVLLGNFVITKVRNSDLMSASSTPCKVCLTVNCSHDSSQKFDSLIFDGGLFREYVVYENCLAYPEYVIYYDRV